MLKKNFYVATDDTGHMPQLSYDKPEHPCGADKMSYVQYVNNKPVTVKPYPGQKQVWDYSTNEPLALVPGIKHWHGAPMDLYKGAVIHG